MNAPSTTTICAVSARHDQFFDGVHGLLAKPAGGTGALEAAI
jgi:hypothetical protein